jgi:hypothetical protein
MIIQPTLATVWKKLDSLAWLFSDERIKNMSGFVPYNETEN